MKTYMYNGPVYLFDKTISPAFITQTKAISKKKAMSNICFQAKQKMKLLPQAKITLDVRYIKEVN